MAGSIAVIEEPVSVPEFEALTFGLISYLSHEVKAISAVIKMGAVDKRVERFILLSLSE